MKTYYTYTIKGEEPTSEHPKILRREQLMHEVNLEHKDYKYDLYKVIKNSEQDVHYEKICIVDEFEYQEFEE